MSTTRRAFTLIAAAASVAAILPALAKEVREPEIFTDFQGHALKGYDVVAYHLENKAVKGNAAYTARWKDADWLFSSAENRDKFVANPERWAPQYGGYCAWAVSTGRTAPVNPEIFLVDDGKLYLNLNMDIHKRWRAKQAVFITRANEKWPGVLVLAK